MVRDVDSYPHVLTIEEAIRIHGPFRGIVLTVLRLIRCNAFAKQRVDPAPGRKS